MSFLLMFSFYCGSISSLFYVVVLYIFFINGLDSILGIRGNVVGSL